LKSIFCARPALPFSAFGKLREILISPRRRNAESGMNQQQRLAAQRREKIQRLDFLAASGGQRRFAWRKNGTSEPSAAASSFSFSAERLAEQFVQREQRGRGVAAAAAQAGGQRNFFLQMNFYAVGFSPPAKTRWPRDEPDCANPPADVASLHESSTPPPRAKNSRSQRFTGCMTVSSS
jgi:hypothetical protein